MARIIMKSPYLKPNAVKHLANYARYIATRDGVEKPSDSKKFSTATVQQKKVIAELVKMYPDSKELYEYEDYQKNPTRENANEFILRAAETHGELLGGREKYVDYIATRPRVEKIADHGLFTDDGVPVILEQAAREISEHTGNVWTHIISLRREDAERLGYDLVEQWQALLRSQRNMIAQQMKIAPENFRWYAAFHNEGHHPHVHMMAFSVKPDEPYLTEKGIRTIKANLAKEIFRQDLISIYEKQTESRNMLRQSSAERIAEIVGKINDGGYDNPRAEQMLTRLAHKLSRTSGKKQYGYLKSDVKDMVNAIVDMLAEDERIAKLYDLWYEQKFETFRTYTDTMPDKLPLSLNPDFKSIRNAVITEAMHTIPDIKEPHDITVTFKKAEYQIDVVITPEDSASASKDSFKVEYKDKGSFEVLPTEGYEIKEVKLTNNKATVSRDGNNITVSNVTGADTVTVEMKLKHFTITVEENEDWGVATPSNTGADYGTEGETVTIVPNDKRRVDSVTINGVPVPVINGVVTIPKIVKDVVVKVNYAPDIQKNIIDALKISKTYKGNGRPLQDFAFKFTPIKVVNEDGSGDIAGQLPPEVDLTKIRFAGEDLNGASFTKDKGISIDFSEKDVGKIFVYEVEEIKGSNPYIHYDTAKYKMEISIRYNDAMDDLLFTINWYDATGEIEGKLNEGGGTFANEYNPFSRLTVSKEVTGSAGNKVTKYFDFKVTLYKDKECTQKADDFNGAGTISNGSDVSFVNGVAEFKLKHGDVAAFENVNANYYYIVEELNFGNYKPSINGGETKVDGAGNVIGTTDVAKLEPGDRNAIAYNNVFDLKPPTGIFTRGLPFALLAVLGMLGFAGFIFFRKKKSNEQ